MRISSWSTDVCSCDLMGVLLRRLRQEETGKVMMIGHNPGLARLAITLAGDGPPTELARLRQAFPTAAFAEIRFSAGRWADVVPGGGRLARFVVPRPGAGAPYRCNRRGRLQRPPERAAVEQQVLAGNEPRPRAAQNSPALAEPPRVPDPPPPF